MVRRPALAVAPPTAPLSDEDRTRDRWRFVGPSKQAAVNHVPPFTPDPRIFPFRSRWFESRVGPVHYIDEGEGEPILFLHGNPTWSFIYRGIVIRLKKRFRCLALDYPGFGLSARPDGYGYTPADHAAVVRDFVQRMDLRGLTIMGHEWGGPIGLRVAADEIDRLRALVMGNTWFSPVDGWAAKSFGYVMSMAPTQSQILDRNLLVERFMPMGVKHGLHEDVLHHYREAMPTPKSRVGAAELAIQLISASPWLARLRIDVEARLQNVPLLLTWGLHDHLFGRSFMEQFREAFRAVELRRLDAKHFIQEDAPGEIASAIETLLTNLDVSSGSGP